MAAGTGTLRACNGRAFGVTVGMLKIGYARQRDATGHREIADLEAAGCQVVRIEPSATGQDVLTSILEFIGPGDHLVVPRLDDLAVSRRTLLDTLDRLEMRGACLRVLSPQFDSQGASGRALRAGLDTMAGLDPEQAAPSRRRPTGVREIDDLQQAGLGPVEIARRLGVSRMTVWRRLKAKDAIHG